MSKKLIPRTEKALAQIEQVAQALAVASKRMNDAVHDHVVALATRNGSSTSPGVRYVHFANMTAKAALGLAKSSAEVIETLPIGEQALLALVRRGVTERMPMWTNQARSEGGLKSHNRILKLARGWAETQVVKLRELHVTDLVKEAVDE